MTGKGRRRWLPSLLTLAVIVGLAAPKLLPVLGPTLDGLRNTVPSSRAGPSAEDRAPRPLSVSAVAVAPGTLSEIVTSTGTLLADEAVELQAEVTGRIVSIDFEEGARVAAGARLVKLNDAELAAMRAAALEELAHAERTEQRMAELLAQSFVRQEEYDAAESQADVRRAEIDLIDARIAKTEIRAPFNGVAGLRYVSEGAIVNASTRIATLQRTDTLKIEFALPERYAGRIAIGAPIAFTVAGHVRVFHGSVYAHDPRVDPETRTLLLRAAGPNEEGLLLPGSFANVRVTLHETRDALLIPAYALMPDLEAAYVFVAHDGTAERRRVEVGIRTDSEVQILSGLAPGELVITSGLQQLRPGAAVRILMAPALSHALPRTLGHEQSRTASLAR